MAVRATAVHAALKNGVALLQPWAFMMRFAPIRRRATTMDSMADQLLWAIAISGAGLSGIMTATGSLVAELMRRAIAIGNAGMLFIATTRIGIAAHTGRTGSTRSTANALLFKSAVREVSKSAVLFTDRTAGTTTGWVVHRAGRQT